MSKYILWFSLYSLVLLSCANTSSPTGGEGDKIPPRLQTTEPASGTTEIKSDAEIALTFSEWIEPKSAQKGIQISPKVDSGVTISVRGRTIKVKPNGTWQKDRTYHISTNSELFDYNQNALDSVTDMVFSTGQSLDKGMLSGTVNIFPILKTRPKVGLYLEEHLSEIDTTLLTPFDYITQCDSIGSFHFENIATASYKIIAFLDDDANNIVTPGETVFLATKMLTSTEDEAVALLQGSSDSTALTLEKAKPINKTTLIYTVKKYAAHRNTALLATVRNKEGDTLVSDIPYILGADSTFFLLTLSTPLEQSQYELITKIPRPFVDTTGLPYYFDTTLFNGITESDTTKPTILSIKKFTEKTICGFTLNWSLPMAYTADTQYLQDTLGNSYPFYTKPGLKKQVQYRSIGPLPAEQTLSIPQKSFTGKTVAGTGSVTDSTDTTTITVKTLSTEAVAHSLTILIDSLPSNGLLHLTAINGSTEYLLPMSQDSLFLKTPLSGKYSLAIHRDLNNNNRKDLATLFPFVKGEETRYLKDTIVVPPRWEVEHSLSLKVKPQKREHSPSKTEVTQ